MKTSDRPRAGISRLMGFLLAVILIAVTVPLTILGYIAAYTSDEGLAYPEVIDFLNNHTPDDAIIESYDSELFFLLERPYHYPPDQLSVDLVRRREFKLDEIIHYDPLIADPDYIVVGGFGRMWQLYDDVVKTEEFRLVRDFSRYQVYERVRP